MAFPFDDKFENGISTEKLLREQTIIKNQFQNFNPRRIAMQQL
jgi:hypothetical protein